MLRRYVAHWTQNQQLYIVMRWAYTVNRDYEKTILELGARTLVDLRVLEFNYFLSNAPRSVL